MWDASKGGAALRVVPFDDGVLALAIRSDASGSLWLSGSGGGELSVKTGTTPLTLACYKRDLDKMSALIRQGARVDQEDGDGYTPLFVASLKGHVDAACLLLDAGAAVDKRPEGELSPFGIACARWHAGGAAVAGKRRGR